MHVSPRYRQCSCLRAHAETVLGLLRNPKYCVYAASQMFNERTLSRGEDTFNRISMEERGKYKEETLVNYGGRQRSAPSRCAAGICVCRHDFCRVQVYWEGMPSSCRAVYVLPGVTAPSLPVW